MRSIHSAVSLAELCELFGKSRQAWYQSSTHAHEVEIFHGEVLDFVQDTRKDQPKIGTFKLWYLLNDKGISIGRDALYNLLRTHRMLIRRRKIYRPASTNGNGESIYPDLRKGLAIIEINQLWCCDITYINLNTPDRHCYGNFVTDEKSHLIVGYHLSLNMTAHQTLKALEMAVDGQAPPGGKFDYQLIFHTDRGSQFKSHLFRNFHDQHEIKISMTEAGESAENPVSERLNGILKHELLIDESFDSFEIAQQAIDRAVYIYNEKRPHLSCNMLTPSQAHKPGLGVLKKLWRPRKKKQRSTPLQEELLGSKAKENFE